MIVLELNEVEVDHCCDCGGVWLDGGELELLVGNNESGGDSSMQLIQAENCLEVTRKCPRCGKKMLKQYLETECNASQDKILLDSCSAGCGLWFDKGELSEALTCADSKNVVLKQLLDIFGRKE